MALILSIETSSSICSVALHDRGDFVGTFSIDQPQAHAAMTAVLVKNLFSSSGRDMQDLRAVAVSSGPGSYTGLRIGTSLVKGICMGLQIPLLAIPTLDLIAASVNEKNAYLCPMIDARRMEVFCKVVDASGKVYIDTTALIIDENSFHELLDSRPMLFFGDGAAKCRAIMKHRNANFIDGIVPLAQNMGRLASEKFAAEKFEDLVSFVPYYLKDFQAKKAASYF